MLRGAKERADCAAGDRDGAMIALSENWRIGSLSNSTGRYGSTSIVAEPRVLLQTRATRRQQAPPYL